MLLGYNFKLRPNSYVLGTAGLVMTISLLIKGCLHSKGSLTKVKTRLTTLYVVQKLIIIISTTIIDQLKVCKLKWRPILIDTHISTHYKSHAFEQAYMITGYGWGKGEENSFIFSTSRPTLLWPHFHENLSGVIVHIYNRNTESPHLAPPLKIISKGEY